MKLVTSNYKQLELLSLMLVLFLFGCGKKSSEYDKGSILLTAEEASNGIELKWNNVNSNDFVRYEVYRSTSPIPDPTSKVPINASFLIGTISNSDNHFFIDSLSSGTNYYRVQVVLKFRNLVSNNIQKQNGVSFLGTFSESGICRDLNLIYCVNTSGQFTVYDYQKDVIVLQDKPMNLSKFYIGKNGNNEPALFGISTSPSNVLLEFNPTTLEQTDVHPLPTYTDYFAVGDGVLYFNYNGDSIVTYSLATDKRIGGVACNGAYMLNLSENHNSMLVTSSGFNQVFYFNIGSDKLPVLYYNVNDTYNLMNFCKISSNGNYMINQSGQLLGKNMNYLGKFQPSNFSSFADFAFTSDELNVLGNQQTSIILFKTADQQLMNTYFISNSFFNAPKIYVNGDKLIIIINSFDQLTGQMIVTIKKKLLDL